MPDIKLTDAQRVVLAAAGARESSLVLPLPKSLASNKASATRILQSLLTKGLIGERPAEDGEEVWPGAETDQSTLEITTDGLAAIGIEGGKPGEDGEPEAGSKKMKPRSRPGPTTTIRHTPRAKRVGAAAQPVTTPKPSSKLGLVIAALRTRKGVTIAELIETTGWQAHSIRGAISGALKKKLGLEVSSTSIEGRGRVYKIESASK